MILRKPYALFIKYFRLIHVILTLLIAYLMFQTNNVLSFYNSYISKPNIGSGIDFSAKYFNIYMFVLPFIIIILLVTILSLMAFKKKPVVFYITNIAVYTFLIIIYYIALNNVQVLEIRAVDIRVTRAIRDLLMGTFFLQSFSAVITFIRSSGFDIKKFNFGKDIDALKVKETDREEFEIDIALDSDSLIRKYKRKIRHLKYAYLENKYLINLIMFILALTTIFILFLNTYVLNKVYQQNEYFNTTDLSIKINNSHITTKDYKNIVINNNKTMVIIKIELRNNYAIKVRLDSLKAQLLIDNKVFKPTNKYDKQMIDLGKSYNNNYLPSGISTYILVYEITNDLATKNMEFSYNDNTGYDSANPKYIKVKLKPTNLDTNVVTKQYNVGKEINFKDSVLKNSKLMISDSFIANNCVLVYNYCASPTDCYKSYENLTPSIINNVPKMIMRLNATLTLDNKTSDVYDFLLLFGKLKYVLNGNTYTQNQAFKQIKSQRIEQKDYYYVEILSEIDYSTNISLIFSIRNQTYEYILK